MDFFRIERDDAVAIATLDKPPANTLDYPLYEELKDLLTDLEADDSVRSVVFASANERIFISGADIGDMKTYDRSPDAIGHKVDTVHAAFGKLQRFPKPTVAAIAGHALGGGCEFALCIDFRVMMSGGPTIGLPEVNLGIVPGGGGTQRLPRLVGRGRALELLMLGTRLGAEEALAAGLVHLVAEDRAGTLERAVELAWRLAAQAPVAVRLIKHAVNDGLEDLASGLAIERAAVIEAMQTEDSKEGIAAFLEKRDPQWQGR